MMKARRSIIAFLCGLALACGYVPLALAQKSEPLPQEPLTASTPKDVHTRAKLHTELGSLYFQSGNYIVALEEMTIAIAIN